MKILTIRQPWLRAITHGDKRTENRNRAPSQYLIGERIGLHAARMLDPMKNWKSHDLMLSHFLDAGGILDKGSGRVPAANDFHLGCIIATAVVSGFVRVGPMTTRGRREYDVSHAPKRYRPEDDLWLANMTGSVGWILEDVQVLPVAVKAKGQLYVWDWELPLATMEVWA